MIPLFFNAALAADGPSIWAREAVGVALFPSGAISNTLVEVRAPLHRADSLVFKDTFAGAGAQLMVSPAFVLVGPRVSVSPVDVFELTLKGMHGWYFDNGLGTMAFEQLTGTLSEDRGARDGVAAEVWSATAEPTLKAKVWKVIVFDAWTIDYLSFQRPAGVTSPYTYEPLRDLVLSWGQEVTFEHQAGLLFEPIGGKDKPFLRVGPSFRDRWAHVSTDRSTTLGVLVAGRPGVKPAIPTIVGMALWYLADNDYKGATPYIAAQVRWDIERSLGKPTAGG